MVMRPILDSAADLQQPFPRDALGSFVLHDTFAQKLANGGRRVALKNPRSSSTKRSGCSSGT